MTAQAPQQSVSVLGTGNFGQAIGKRLLRSQYDVTFGSRRPKSRDLQTTRDDTFGTPRVVGMREAMKESDVIVLALRVANFQSFAREFRSDVAGKIIVDVSNRSKSTPVSSSNAEFLQGLLPEARVVKAFSVTSAYTMEVDMDGSARLVPVASDHSGPKQVVMDMARQLGFKPYDAGGLAAAQGVEERVTQLFPEWRLPVAITVVILCLWSVYVAYVYFIGRTVYSWEQIFVKVLNKPVAMTAITVFALTYLPGCLAGFLQLHRGTKHSRFPHWLDAWMRMRKQLGLVAFALACVHVFISAMTLSPTYYHSWFHHVDVTLHRNLTSDVVRLTLPAKSWMTWKGELSCLTGLITLVTFTILALTSLPSVGESLNWSEWRFVQSGLGTFGLLMCVGHTLVMGVPSWLSRNFRILSLLQSVTFTSTLLAVVVLLLKLVLATPCLRGPLRRIRHGWERGSPPISDEESGSNGVTSRDVMSSASTTRTSDLMTSRPYRNGGKHNAGSCCQENGIAMGDVGGGGRGGSDGNENGGYSNSCIEMNEQNVGKGGNTPSR